MKHLTFTLITAALISSTALFGQSYSMDWYKGNWTVVDGSDMIPRLEIIAESEATLKVRVFKDCSEDNCFWQSASSIPVSAQDAEVDPVKNADMLNGAFINANEKVFFDLMATGENQLSAEINILTADGPKSLLLMFERQSGLSGMVSGNKEKPKGGSIHGVLTSEESRCSDYTVVIFNPKTGQNNYIKPEAQTCGYKIEELPDGSYYYSVNIPDGSKEKTRFETDYPHSPIIIVNGETIEMNIKALPMSLFDNSEYTSN